MKYRIKFGDWQTAERVYLVGEIIELTEEQAAGFLDKLELISEVIDEATPVDETVVAKKKKG